MSSADDDPRVEALLREAPDRLAKPLTRRERLVQGAFAAALLAVAVAMAVAFPREHTDVLTAGLLLVLALVSVRVRFTIGAYAALGVQLAVVPVLLLLPPATAIALLALASVLSHLPDLARGRMHPDNAISWVADQWYAAGPALVIALFAPLHPELSAWPIYLAAFAAQLVFDTGSAVLRVRLAKGVPPELQLRTSLLVMAVDGALAPLGLLVALVVATTTPLALLLVVPLLGLLELLGRERERRIEHTLALSEAYRGSALLMGEMLEADDEYTGGEHSKGVVALALAVGLELGLDAREQRELEFGSLLHDIGKLRTPDEIINKPGKLTDEEWAIIKRHPEDGQAMLDRIGGVLADVGLVVRHHHERWEGGGYPDGIAGEDIPLAARIITACDACSAMTTNRSYRKAMPIAEAVAELRSCTGTQFDPRVVKALIAVVEREAPAPLSELLAA